MKKPVSSVGIIFNKPEQKSYSAAASSEQALSKLFRKVMEDHGVDRVEFNNRLYAYTEKLFPGRGESPRRSNFRHNTRNQIFRTNAMTWTIFCRALKIIGLQDIDLQIITK